VEYGLGLYIVSVELMGNNQKEARNWKQYYELYAKFESVGIRGEKKIWVMEPEENIYYYQFKEMQIQVYAIFQILKLAVIIRNTFCMWARIA